MFNVGWTSTHSDWLLWNRRYEIKWNAYFLICIPIFWRKEEITELPRVINGRQVYGY